MQTESEKARGAYQSQMIANLQKENEKLKQKAEDEQFKKIGWKLLCVVLLGIMAGVWLSS